MDENNTGQGASIQGAAPQNTYAKTGRGRNVGIIIGVIIAIIVVISAYSIFFMKSETTFTESGLPSETVWYVTYNGTTHNSTTNLITFQTGKGNYSYVIDAVTTNSSGIFTSGYEPQQENGTLTSGTKFAIQFNPFDRSKYVYVTDGNASLLAISSTNYSITKIPIIINPTQPSYSHETTDVAVNPNGRFAYVTFQTAPFHLNATTYGIAVVNTSTNMVAKYVYINSTYPPYGISVTPDGRYAYVSDLGNQTYIINLSTYQVIKQLNFKCLTSIKYNGLGCAIAGVAIEPNGNAYLTDQDTNLVFVVNTTTFATTKTINLSTPHAFAGYSGAYSIALTSNDKYAVVTAGIGYGLYTINITSGKVSKVIVPFFSAPLGVAIPKNSGYAYVVNFTGSSLWYVNISSGQIANNVELPNLLGISRGSGSSANGPRNIALSPDNKVLYVTDTTGGLYIINATSFQIMKEIPTGGSPSSVSDSRYGGT